MSKLNTLAAGVLLSGFLFAGTSVNAATEPDPAAPPADQGTPAATVKQTPQAVLNWQEKQKMRREVQLKAAAMRQQLIMESQAQEAQQQPAK